MKSRYVAQARVWNAGAEMLARKDNFVELDPEVKDRWGIPVLKIHFTHSDNDYKLIEDFQQNAEELFRKAGGEVHAGAGDARRVSRARQAHLMRRRRRDAAGQSTRPRSHAAAHARARSAARSTRSAPRA